MKHLLEVQQLHIVFQSRNRELQAVRDVSFHIDERETTRNRRRERQRQKHNRSNHYGNAPCSTCEAEEWRHSFSRPRHHFTLSLSDEETKGFRDWYGLSRSDVILESNDEDRYADQ